MSRMPWSQFLHRQSQAHLVVGVAALAEGPIAGDELKEVRNLLNRLVRQQKPRGDYAATVVRDTGRPEAWFAFDDETDARSSEMPYRLKRPLPTQAGRLIVHSNYRHETGRSGSLASGVQL